MSSMPEPVEGSYVMVGVAPDETVYLRDDIDADETCRWMPLTENGTTAADSSWADILGFDEPIQRLWPGIDLWVGVYRHLDDAHNAGHNPDFEAGLAFAAALFAETLGLERPPWA